MFVVTAPRVHCRCIRLTAKSNSRIPGSVNGDFHEWSFQLIKNSTCGWTANLQREVTGPLDRNSTVSGAASCDRHATSGTARAVRGRNAGATGWSAAKVLYSQRQPLNLVYLT